ncbi:MAG: magnesium/cobalt transporter CorA [Actinobacteria bacterium]|nr:magnesium/cobalt transporter CorA [Actinomycetota bacterium]
MIVDSAIYVDGRRSAPSSLEEIRETSRTRSGFAWVGLYEPTEEEFDSIAGEFGLHELAIKDAIKPHQRPKVERYGDTLFVVLKVARYLEEKEAVEFGEIHAFVGPDFVVTMRYGEASKLGGVRRRMEGEPELLRKGPFAVLYTIMSRIVDDYGPVADGLENDIDEIEVEVFGGNPGVSRRIYELSREVIQFHQATQPLARALESLTEGGLHDAEIRGYLRDVRDRALRVTERVEGFRELLSNILTVNFTIVGMQQNDQTKKISAWAAIVIVPTLIAGIYGMNFDYMPELHWRFGYPFAISLMALLAFLLYLRFKRSGWL